MCSGLMIPDTHFEAKISARARCQIAKARRSLSTEFKREAAALVLDQDYSHIEASRSLEVVESAFRRRVKQLGMERDGVTPQAKR
jgi:transposase